MTCRRRILIGVLCAWGAALASRATSPTPALDNAWQALSIGDYAAAAEQFARAGPSRTAELGAAIALINRPPLTPASLAAARQRLTALASTNDEAGRAGRFFLGRLLQLDPLAADPAGAAREYAAVVATGEDDTWCRLALIKLTILRLTVLPGPGDLSAQLAATEPALRQTRDPVTQRDLHLLIAEARLNHELYDATTLGHLQAALAATGPADVLRPDVLVQIGRLATKLGDLAEARAVYETFLRDYPKDRRNFTVTSALEHLGRAFPP